MESECLGDETSHKLEGELQDELEQNILRAQSWSPLVSVSGETVPSSVRRHIRPGKPED
jgi:hypothetical protein